MDKSTIGEILRTRRRYLNIDQRTLALLAGVGLNTIVAMERGEGNPRLTTMLSVLDTLGFELNVN